MTMQSRVTWNLSSPRKTDEGDARSHNEATA